MNLKNKIKKVTPKFIHYIYNRLISKKIIGNSLGDWFDLEWKSKADKADLKQWVKTYDESWENWKEQDLSNEDIVRIKKLIPQSNTLLDAGCGDGYLLEHLTENSNLLFGLDISGTGLKKASKRLNEKGQFFQAFIENLPFADNSFETVISAHTLEHVKNLREAISELKRVASKKLIILVPSQEYLPYTMDYHLHFFPDSNDLLKEVNISGAKIQRYTIPEGQCAYQGDVLLLSADL